MTEATGSGRAGPDDCLFHRDGDVLHPTDLTQGPWDPTAQHGGPVTAVLADSLERLEAPVPMRVTRLSVDLMRPVPMTQLDLRTDVLRTGRKVQLAQAVLSSAGVDVARASALSVRVEPGVVDFDPAAHRHPGDEPLPPPGEEHAFVGARGVVGYLPGFIRAVSLIRAQGQQGDGGVAEVWFKLHCRVVDDRELTPLVRTAAIADFTSGLGNSLDFAQYTSINPDVNLTLLRHPVGEWIGLRAITKLSTDGIGFSEAAFHDDEGRFGRGVTSLVLQAR